MRQKIIYTHDLALFMGLSEAAVRSHIQRRSWPQAIPPPFRIGKKWAWSLHDIEKWVSAKTKQTETSTKWPNNRKRGRPRKRPAE